MRKRQENLWPHLKTNRILRVAAETKNGETILRGDVGVKNPQENGLGQGHEYLSGDRKRQEEWGKSGLFNTLQYLCTHTQTSKTSALESPQSTLFIRFLFCSYVTIATTAAATTRGTIDPCASRGGCGCSNGALVWVSGVFLGLRAVSRLLGVSRRPPWSSHCMDFSQEASTRSILSIVL